MNKKIKLVIFDVDGTLYDNKAHLVPTSTIKAIKLMKKAGIKFVIASGRSHYALGNDLECLKPDYILSVSGGVISDGEGNILSHLDLSLEQVEVLNAFAKENEAGLCYKFLDRVYFYYHPEKIDWLDGQIRSDIGAKPFVMSFHKDRHLNDLPQAACLHVSSSLIPKLGTTGLEFFKYSEDGYDVVLKGTNKGKAIEILMEKLSYTKDEIAVFGDNYNDMEMFEVIENSIAMGNAIPEIKEKAMYITKSVCDDGVYNGLAYLGCIPYDERYCDKEVMK